MLLTSVKIKVLLAALLFCVWATSAQANPITFHFQGYIPTFGVSPHFTNSEVAVGDTFTGSVTFDIDAIETFSFPGIANFYRDAITGISITYQTSSGPISYATDNTVNSLVINQIAVWDSRLSMEVTDFDSNGTQAPVTGPSVPGEYSGTPIDFQPIFIRFEITNDFSAYLNSHTLPSPENMLEMNPFMVDVSFQGMIAPGSYLQAWYYGQVVDVYRDQDPIIPEPATLILVGLGLAGTSWHMRKKKE